jgi:hypothetical protein
VKQARMVLSIAGVLLGGGLLASCSDDDTSGGAEDTNSVYAGQYDAANTARVQTIGWGQEAFEEEHPFPSGILVPVRAVSSETLPPLVTPPDQLDLSNIGSPEVFVEAHPTKANYVRLGVNFTMSYRVIVENDGTVTGSATGFTTSGKCNVRGSTTIVNKVATWTGTTSCTSELTGTCTVTGTQTIDFSPVDPVLTGVIQYKCPIGEFKSSYNAVLTKTSAATATMEHLQSADGVKLSGLPVF